MDRIYMNRIDGQRRIHVEITDSEVSDLLEDLKADPEHYGSTAAFLAILDAAEETFSPVVAEGRRDRAARTAAARQTTGQDDTEPPKHRIIPVCDQCGAPWATGHTCADPTNADDPTPLRWGLGDVLHSDDDTVIVCLSVPAPDRAPYWLELDAERAAALREDLAVPPSCTCDSAGPAFVPAGHYRDCPQHKEPAPAVGQPAEAQATDEAHPADVTFTVEKRGDTDWLTASSHYDQADRDKALSRLARRRQQYPDTEFRLVRETTTWTVEDER